jgi:hypothetical protein
MQTFEYPLVNKLSKRSLNFVTLPLTCTRRGEEFVPLRSGLNWGQRPGRDKDQAYLSIPSEVRRCGFFPLIAEEFEIFCDDGEVLCCARAQQFGKALQTIKCNSILGKYFRKRLGLASGHFITIQHLFRYGRLSVDVSKENGKYFLDFSVKS